MQERARRSCLKKAGTLPLPHRYVLRWYFLSRIMCGALDRMALRRTFPALWSFSDGIYKTQKNDWVKKSQKTDTDLPKLQDLRILNSAQPDSPKKLFNLKNKKNKSSKNKIKLNKKESLNWKVSNGLPSGRKMKAANRGLNRLL